MNATSTIARLEALLARVLTRSADRPATSPAVAPSAVAEPSALAQPPAAPPPVAAPLVVAQPPAVPPPVAPLPVEPPAAAPPTAMADSEDEGIDIATIPPPAQLDEPDVDIVAATDGGDTSPDVVIGEALTVEEALLDEVSDSRERLVAAEPVEPAPAVDFEEEPAQDDDIKGEEAPASSRRPVAPAPEERLAELAFGAEEPAAAGRTPPPKSGPLPAPPLDFDPDVTGVRKSVPPDDPGPALVRELTPQVARLQVAEARDPIVDVIGEAQRFAPPTFASLLEASLSL